MYKEIISLYKWCEEQNISCMLSTLYDGYKITFKNSFGVVHSDVVQHMGSYGSKEGYVEPAGFSISYAPVTVEQMKDLILKEIKGR